MNDYGPEFDAFVERVRKELVPKIEQTNLVISITPESPEKVDVKFALELGLAIMYDKPIISVIKPGGHIPAKLAKVVDRFVEMDFNDPTQTSRLNEVIKEMMEENPT
jgi:hypothetical protein